jgi:hypothetical protein
MVDVKRYSGYSVGIWLINLIIMLPTIRDFAANLGLRYVTSKGSTLTRRFINVLARLSCPEKSCFTVEYVLVIVKSVLIGGSFRILSSLTTPSSNRINNTILSLEYSSFNLVDVDYHSIFSRIHSLH